MAFDDERESYRALQRLLGERTIYLVDTFDTVHGAQIAAELGAPLWGVRLDSGNLVELAREVRHLLDASGFRDAKIMVSGDLDEYKMREMVATGAPVDVFGVGTELATSSDAPNLSAVYKMVAIESRGEHRYTFKSSNEKTTTPGAKQVFRHAEYDEIAEISERCEGAEPLLQPVIRSGSLVARLPSAAEARDYCADQLRRVRPDRRVEYSETLRRMAEQAREHLSKDKQ
jgi:nicotinate phosphoribosyltransferase